MVRRVKSRHAKKKFHAGFLTYAVLGLTDVGKVGRDMGWQNEEEEEEQKLKFSFSEDQCLRRWERLGGTGGDDAPAEMVYEQKE